MKSLSLALAFAVLVAGCDAGKQADAAAASQRNHRCI